MTFHSIAVVDDKVENLQAASAAIAEMFPSSQVHLFSSAAEIIAALKAQSIEIDLVLTDLEMEDRHAGHRVAVEAWAWNIPATIITGGHGHGTDYVTISYPRQSLSMLNKATPRAWKAILQSVVSGDISSNGLLTAKSLGKRTVPNYEVGKVCAVVVTPTPFT